MPKYRETNILEGIAHGVSYFTGGWLFLGKFCIWGWVAYILNTFFLGILSMWVFALVLIPLSTLLFIKAVFSHFEHSADMIEDEENTIKA